MFLVIDNYDSFVHNLARYFEIGGVNTRVVRNTDITIDEIKDINPDAIILSPGPCTPKEAGICIKAVKTFGQTTPILGVCLGHQAIGEAYGDNTSRADTPVHGKASTITHDGTDLFKNIPTPIKVGRYHSLMIERKKSSPLNITAKTEADEIMAVHHKTHPVYGVQFHPESVLTEHGQDIVNNFIAIAKQWHTLNKTKP